MIKSQVEEEAVVIQDPRLKRKGANACPRDPLRDLASTVASKLEKGNFKGAVSLAVLMILL